jgi:hypothetical protein
METSRRFSSPSETTNVYDDSDSFEDPGTTTKTIIKVNKLKAEADLPRHQQVSEKNRSENCEHGLMTVTIVNGKMDQSIGKVKEEAMWLCFLNSERGNDCS